MRAVRSLVLLGLVASTHAQTPPVVPTTTGPCAGVLFFKDCDYGGERSQPVAPGTYTTDQLYKMGAWNNAISSAQIPFGCQLEVYSQDNFLGDSHIFNTSDPCFVDDQFNDKVSSVKVKVAYWSAAPTQKPTPRPPVVCKGGTGGDEANVCKSGQCSYLDLGEKGCNGICGHPIKFTYASTRGESCANDCSGMRNCTGYSVSSSNNCMLWHEHIGSLGNDWGRAHCMVKQCEGQTTAPPHGTCNPTKHPTLHPTGPTHHPTKRPTVKPTKWVDAGAFSLMYGDWSWTDAQNHCQTKGENWDLASILSDKDLLALRTVSGSTQCWIGLNDIMEDKKWVWTDGSPFSYNHWNPDEPNNHGGTEHCVELTPANSGGGWNDNTCSHRQSACCGYRKGTAANTGKNPGEGMRAGVIVLIIIGAVVAVCVLGRFILFENKPDHFAYQQQSNIGDINANTHLVDSSL